MAANQNPNRKSESIRRANRIIQTRSFVLMILMGVVMFVLLFFRLFDLQITRGAPFTTPQATFWLYPPVRRRSSCPRWRSITR